MLIPLLLQRGSTALLKACRWGYTDCVRALMKSEDIHVNHQDQKGFTALLEAARYGHHEAVRFLVDKDADVLIKDMVRKVSSVI